MTHSSFSNMSTVAIYPRVQYSIQLLEGYLSLELVTDTSDDLIVLAILYWYYKGGLGGLFCLIRHIRAIP